MHVLVAVLCWDRWLPCLALVKSSPYEVFGFPGSHLMPASGQSKLFSGLYLPNRTFRELSWNTAGVSLVPQTPEKSRFTGRADQEHIMHPSPSPLREPV